MRGERIEEWIGEGIEEIGSIGRNIERNRRKNRCTTKIPALMRDFGINIFTVSGLMMRLFLLYFFMIDLFPIIL